MCQLCDAFIHDVILSPLPLASPLRPHISIEALERCIETVITSFKKASNNFKIEFPLYMTDLVFWEHFNEYLPKLASEIKFAIDVCTDASVARKTKEPSKLICEFLASRFYKLLKEVPSCHHDHSNKTQPVNIGSLGPVPDWQIRRIKNRLLYPEIYSKFGSSREPEIYY